MGMPAGQGTGGAMNFPDLVMHETVRHLINCVD